MSPIADIPKMGVTVTPKYELKFKDLDLSKFGKDNTKQVGGTGYAARATFKRPVAKGWNGKVDVTTACLVKKDLSGVTLIADKPGTASVSYGVGTKDLKAEASRGDTVQGKRLVTKVSTSQNANKAFDATNITLSLVADIAKDRRLTSVYNHKSKEEQIKLWMKLKDGVSLEPSVKLKSREVAIAATQQLGDGYGTLKGTLNATRRCADFEWNVKPFKFSVSAKDLSKPTLLQAGISLDACHFI